MTHIFDNRSVVTNWIAHQLHPFNLVKRARTHPISILCTQTHHVKFRGIKVYERFSEIIQITQSRLSYALLFAITEFHMTWKYGPTQNQSSRFGAKLWYAECWMNEFCMPNCISIENRHEYSSKFLFHCCMVVPITRAQNLYLACLQNGNIHDSRVTFSIGTLLHLSLCEKLRISRRNSNCVDFTNVYCAEIMNEFTMWNISQDEQQMRLFSCKMAKLMNFIVLIMRCFLMWVRSKFDLKIGKRHYSTHLLILNTKQITKFDSYSWSKFAIS